LGLFYLCFGGSCREEERRSFGLYITPTTIHFDQKMYQLGCCCQQTTKKSIPLDKVQDVMLVSDCCGDTCGFATAPGRPYKMVIQTAGAAVPDSGPSGSNLFVFCIEDPDAFRSQVLAQKRRLASGEAAHGQMLATGVGKDAPLGARPYVAAGGDSAAVVAVLERIERALQEGLARMPSR